MKARAHVALADQERKERGRKDGSIALKEKVDSSRIGQQCVG